MKTGTIILIPFPFAELSNTKIRPAVVITQTKDKYQDLILSAISSVVPNQLSENEILLVSSSQNGLRVNSVLKVDRIVTLKKQDIVAKIGELSSADLPVFISKFKNLIDS